MKNKYNQTYKHKYTDTMYIVVYVLSEIPTCNKVHTLGTLYFSPLVLAHKLCN